MTWSKAKWFSRSRSPEGRSTCGSSIRSQGLAETEQNMAKKEITTQFKLQAPAGTATPAPPIGPALGQHGVNPGQFIQKFNAATAALKGKVVGVLVTVYKDRTFTFEVKSPPARDRKSVV